MPNHPAGFREWISGKCDYTAPASWHYVVTPEQVEIVQGWRVIVVRLVVCVVLLGGYVDAVWGSRNDPDFSPVMGIVTGIALFVFVVGFSRRFVVRCLIDKLRGPLLIYSKLDQSITLPPERLTVSKADVLGWRLVSGHRVGREGAQRKNRGLVLELQLIVQKPEGAVAYAIVGSRPGLMTEDVRALAMATGLPLEIVEQPPNVKKAAAGKSPG